MQSALGAFFGKETFEVAALLIGVATIGMLLTHSKETVNIIKGAGEAFTGVVGVVTFQSPFSNYMNG